MNTIRKLAALVLAWTVGSLPACGTMSGGGMKYLVESPPSVSEPT